MTIKNCLLIIVGLLLAVLTVHTAMGATPNVTSVSITPDPAYINNTLTGTYTFNDADNDTDQSTYQWYRNDVLMDYRIRAFNNGFESNDLLFVQDGTRLIEVGSSSGNDVMISNCSRAYDLDSCVFDSQRSLSSDSFEGLDWKPSGEYAYFTVDKGGLNFWHYQYSCSTPFVLSTCTYLTGFAARETQAFDLEFNNDGSKLFTAEYQSNYINEYVCSTEYDLATCSYSQRLVAQSTIPQGITWSGAGDKLYEVDRNSEFVYAYDCGTSYDLSSCSYNSERLNVSGSSFPSGIDWDNDGNLLFVERYQFNWIYTYYCTIDYNLSSCSLLVTDNLTFYNDFTALGDNITFEVSPYDGNNTGVSVNASITITNAPPSASNVNITPTTAYTNTDLTGAYTYTDLEGDADNTILQWYVNSTIVLGANSTVFSSGNFSKDDNITFEVTPNDGTTSGTAINTSLVIQNSLPVVTNQTINAANDSVSINCTASLSDADSDTVTPSYLWYKNSVSTGVTSQTLSAGNYTTNDQLICEVTPNDGTANGTSKNTTAYTVGDIVAPVISAMYVPTSAFTDASTTLTVTCTDDNAVSSVKGSWTDPNVITIGNLTFASSTGDNYTRSYTFNTVGNYTEFTFYCTDGNGNTDTNSASNDLVATTRPATGGGGGGGGVIIAPTPGVSCNVTTLRPGNPSTGLVSIFCPVNGFKDESITLYNPEPSTATYTISYEGEVSCDAVEPVTIPGKSQETIRLSNCACPTTTQRQNGGLQGFIVVSDSRGSIDACTTNIKYQSRGSIIAANPLFYVGVLLLALFILSTLIGVAR